MAFPLEAFTDKSLGDIDDLKAFIQKWFDDMGIFKIEGRGGKIYSDWEVSKVEVFSILGVNYCNITWKYTKEGTPVFRPIINYQLIGKFPVVTIQGLNTSSPLGLLDDRTIKGVMEEMFIDIESQKKWIWAPWKWDDLAMWPWGITPFKKPPATRLNFLYKGKQYDCYSINYVGIGYASAYFKLPLWQYNHSSFLGWWLLKRNFPHIWN